MVESRKHRRHVAAPSCEADTTPPRTPDRRVAMRQAAALQKQKSALQEQDTKNTPEVNKPRHTLRTKVVSTASFIGIIALTLALLALVLYVMGTHREQPEPVTTPQSAYDQQRQDLAISIARTEALAHALATDSHDAVPQEIPTELLSQIDDDAAQWLKNLGGIWVPWPDGAPKGYANPEVDTTPTAYDVPTLEKELNNIVTTLTTNTAFDGRLALPIATQARILQARLTRETDYHEVCHTPDLDVLAQYIGSKDSLENLETARQWLVYDSAQTPSDQRALPNARMDLVGQLNKHILRTKVADGRPALVAPANRDSTSATPAIELVASELMTKASDATAEQREASVAFLCTLSFPENLTIQPQSSQEK